MVDRLCHFGSQVKWIVMAMEVCGKEAPQPMLHSFHKGGRPGILFKIRTLVIYFLQQGITIVTHLREQDPYELLNFQ